MPNVNDLYPDSEKMKELILHICKLSEDDPPFGATKLYKHLFWIDFGAYEKFGTSITGKKYYRFTQGPVPKCLKPIREAMVREGSLRMEKVHYFGKQQYKPVALRPANLSLFTSDELQFISDVVLKRWGMSAVEVSAESHEFIGYKLARPDEEIPYFTIFGRPIGKLTETEIENGKRLEQALQRVG